MGQKAEETVHSGEYSNCRDSELDVIEANRLIIRITTQFSFLNSSSLRAYRN